MVLRLGKEESTKDFGKTTSAMEKGNLYLPVALDIQSLFYLKVR